MTATSRAETGHQAFASALSKSRTDHKYLAQAVAGDVQLTSDDAHALDRPDGQHTN
jgi:hypothetical protein